MHASARRRLSVAAPTFLLSIAFAAGLQGPVAASPGDPQPSAGDGGPLRGNHLYVVPATADGAAANRAVGARTIASYESFSLVSAPGSGNETLRAAGADRRDDMRTVAVADGELDPTAEPSLRAGSGEGLALVQFAGPIKDAWLDDLTRTGARIVTYMAENAYLVHASAAATRNLAALGGEDAVRAVIAFGADDKTAPGIPESGTAEVAVETLAGAAGAAARDVLAGGERLRPEGAYGGTVTRYAAIDAARARELAHDPGVVAIEPWVEPKLLDERAAQIVSGRLTGGTVPTGPGYLNYLSANGFPSTTLPFVVDITDGGVDKGVVPPPAGSHPDFFVGGNTANNTRIRYHQEFGTDTNARDCGGHGTNVASIAAGFNNETTATYQDAQGFNYGLGIAPRARIGNTKIFTCASAYSPGTTFAALRSAAYADGARISNNSWGAPVGGAYTADSREFDFLVRDARPAVTGNQEMVNVFSAGNDGSGANTIGSPGTAKNVITVGASENVRGGGTDGCAVPDTGADNAKDIINFSSRGPTDDGRIKPDVVAPGTHVTGASPQVADYNGNVTCDPQFPAGNTLYSRVSGTSQAAPEVAGLAALIRDWYTREVLGAAPDAVPASLSPALTKAILVNTATDQVGGNNGAGGSNANIPTQIQGWGRVNLRTILSATAREFVDQTQRLDASGESRRTVYAVDDPAKPVKVTLAWTDAPGPTSGNAFVNDLDLRVHAGGSSYKGNVFVNGRSATGGTADPRNNVENVFLAPGKDGNLAVEVRATNIAGDGKPGNADATDQDYALVVSNVTPSTGPVLVHDLATATEAASGDGDAAIEPGETFTLRERLRNLGDGGATGISSVLTESQANLSILQADSAYPNIPATRAKQNATAFRARLAAGWPCGQTARFALDVTTAQGTVEVPFSVPTGGTTTANVDSGDVPKTIADLSTVNSTLTIAGAGTIQDLNVRNVDITHTYTGDLIISLIGPGGSPTVTLFSRRGGSGDNLVNTVFDDEAATAISGGVAPFSGSFRPDSPLSAFDGLAQAGTWTLRVQDMAGGDTGALTAWGLTKSVTSCD